MTDWLQRPLTEIVRRMADREISPAELMERVLDRIEETHGKLNAFVALRDRDALLDDARRAEARIGKGEGGPLEGVPLGVKDREDVAGMVTTQGSAPLRDHMATRDSHQVARLRAAGAIVVGKTNTPEFGYTAITKNLLFGATRNPWNLELTPGGSSGGASAAIAGGVIPLATAGDGGGSVRIPASFTGCFGLKPSYGRIPKGPHELWVMEDVTVHGPLTRTVEDATLHLDAVVGPHAMDPNSLPHPGISYRDVLRDLPSGLRIGFSPDLGYANVQSDVAEVVADAAQVFGNFGKLEAVEGGPPPPYRDWGQVGAFETLSQLQPLLPEHEEEFGRTFIRGVKTGERMTPARWGDYRRAREVLNRWCAELFEEYDLLLTPTVPYDPPAAGGPFPSEVEGREQTWGSVGGFTMPFNLSWHPAASVRAGLSKAGLPVGLQIVGPRHRDDLVLQASYAFEQARPWADDWPEF
jgi:aspartyl-tRNA(Asn)/glutamyl-tRNA(Gln) amidotransferase subunit A